MRIGECNNPQEMEANSNSTVLFEDIVLLGLLKRYWVEQSALERFPNKLKGRVR